MRREITVTIRYFSGIDRDLGIAGHDSGKGINLVVRQGTRLRTVLRRAGLRKLSQYAYFRAGERISPWSGLRDQDEISCFKPSGGG